MNAEPHAGLKLAAELSGGRFLDEARHGLLERPVAREEDARMLLRSV